MMSSVGATSKQIKKSVLFEGLIIGLIGIPTGILLGAVAITVLVWLLNILAVDILEGIKFVYGLPVQVVILTVVMSAITIYLSCIIPARKASKISPIDAIRGNNDVKIKAKKLKTSKLTKKLFGMGGVIASKNLKRSKKKYRTTVISLVVSISIFIALSSFLGYGKKMTGVYYTDLGYNISVSFLSSNANEEKNKVEIYNDIIKNYSLTDYSYSYSNGGTVDVRKYCTEYGKFLAESEAEMSSKYGSHVISNDEYEVLKNQISLQVIGLEKNSFERFAKLLGIKDISNDIGIIADDRMEIDSEGVRSFKTIYNVKEGESIEVKLSDDRSKSIKIVKRTDKRPMGYENSYATGGYLFVSEDSNLIDKATYVTPLYINSDKAIELETKLNDLKRTDTKYSSMQVSNVESYKKQEERMILIISIFLYGFIIVITLIGVTNIFNTITTNMILRSKEFAMLKSVGMTGKEFNRMIRLESILYGLKSLFIGIPIGVGISYAIYKAIAQSTDFGFIIPWQAIIISIVFVFIIVGLTMKYSLNKINKQNIVETIRNDNI